MIKRILVLLLIFVVFSGCSKGEQLPPLTRYCESIKLKIQSGDYSELKPGVNLGGCSFSGLDFSGLDLSSAYFDGADLSGAKFVGTDLTDAIFSRAYISGADFTEANLVDADFTRATIDNANFTNAKVEISQLEQAYSMEGIVYPGGSTE